MPAGVEVATTSSPTLILSGDGTSIAFVGATGGLRRIYVRRFHDSETIQLRGTKLEVAAFFA